MDDLTIKYCLIGTGLCYQVKDWLDISLSFISILIAFIALVISIKYAALTFRPLITVSVKSIAQGDILIVYDLIVLNSGTIPGKNIKLETNNNDISSCLGKNSGEINRSKWLACFSPQTKINILQNGQSTSCSFGTTVNNDDGFWKYGSEFDVKISYESWFGKKYTEIQPLKIVDTNSFTGKYWSSK
jgi:hypothetical protein